MQTVVADNHLKKGVWLYILLLIFEGALRKWVFPGLSSVILVIRDPLAMWIIFMAIKRNLMSFNVFIFAMGVVCFISFLATLLIGHGNLAVAVYGARILILQFPLLFVIGKIFDREDVLRVGRFWVYLTPIMTVLIAFQFYSPQSAWVNLGVGGDTDGGGFSGALGYFRPPGTFSFITGVAAFYGMAAAFIFYFWLSRDKLNKLVLVLATVGLLAAIPLSISRTLFFSVLVVLLFTVIAATYRPKFLGGMIVTAVCGLIVLFILSNTSLFETATEAFTARFESANETEGGLHGVLADRYLGGLVGALAYNSISNPFFGLGLGMGTNVGAMLMSGRMRFLISEGEWGRLIGEMGPLLGVLSILIRLAVSAFLAVSSFRRLSSGDILPWLLVSFALLYVPQGQWAQPTNLGFAVLAGGLVLASLQERKKLEFIDF